MSDWPGEKKSQPPLRWGKNHTPISPQFDDVYFSQHDGLAETQYVFLQNNGLKERFAALADNDFFTVGETGFGTGLNFLATAKLWQNTAPKNARLHFISTEKYPLAANDLEKALAYFSELSELSQPLLAQYREQISPNSNHSLYTILLDNITLTLWVGDVCDGLKALLPQQHPEYSAPLWRGVDAWFLDGFAPAKNPEMWRDELFAQMNLLSRPSATFATFTAAGVVKRGLAGHGFSVKKVRGFGKKREMLIGEYSERIEFTKPVTPSKKSRKLSIPWAYKKSEELQTNQHIAVIGAGLAGCHTAYALAKKGYHVEVFDRHTKPAQKASGNLQGMLYAKLSQQRSDQADFNLASLHFAQRFYQKFWQECDAKSGAQSGLLQLAFDEKHQQQYQAIAKRFVGADFLQYVSKETASQIAGVECNYPALFYPRSGWFNPPALCEWLLNQENIHFHGNTNITAIDRIQDCWQLVSDAFIDKNPFQAVVICNASDALNIEQSQWLPLKPIRGQLTHLQGNKRLSTLKTVITAEGYIAPAIQQGEQTLHTLGASYNLTDTHSEISEQEHQDNLQHLNLLLKNSKEIAPAIHSGRVSFRSTTPDYLPMAGPLPNKEWFEEDYAELKNNAQRAITKKGKYLANAFTNLGHGSRGLNYAPLCSEIIACQISGEPLPIPQPLVDSLNAGRFIIRNLKRKQ